MGLAWSEVLDYIRYSVIRREATPSTRLHGELAEPSEQALQPFGKLRTQDEIPAIRVAGLYKGFGDYPILRGLDITVQWGEFLVILGANGAGKTTLLKILSTLARPDSGEVRIGGMESKGNAQAIRRIIGVVAHQNLLYEDMTCYENLLFYGHMFGLKGLHIRIMEMLNLVGLGARKDRRVRTLSHGMQKRLAIARAILHSPPILLLDEPEAGLDQDALEMLEGLLMGWKEGGGTVVMTTHTLEHGLTWGDQVAILAEGRIVFREAKSSLDLADFKGTYLSYLEAVL